MEDVPLRTVDAAEQEEGGPAVAGTKRPPPLGDAGDSLLPPAKRPSGKYVNLSKPPYSKFKTAVVKMQTLI